MLAHLLLAAALAAAPSDEDVLDAVRAHTAIADLDRGDVCITRPDGFPGVVAVGTMVHDRGCRSWLWVIEGAVLGTARDATARVFPPDQPVSDERLVAWAVDALLPFDGVEPGPKAPDGFRGGRWHAPRVSRSSDGFAVTAWARDPVGMVERPASWSRVTAQVVCTPCAAAPR